MYNTKKTSIKKSIAVFLAITFCVICFDRTVVFASVPNYCSNCGAKLEEHAEHVGNWTEKHYVSTGYYYDGKPVMNECIVYCSMYRVARLCPNGCGVAWSEDKLKETNTSTYCSKYGK